jgi:hypothetical protein
MVVEMNRREQASARVSCALAGPAVVCRRPRPVVLLILECPLLSFVLHWIWAYSFFLAAAFVSHLGSKTRGQGERTREADGGRGRGRGAVDRIHGKRCRRGWMVGSHPRTTHHQGGPRLRSRAINCARHCRVTSTCAALVRPAGCQGRPAGRPPFASSAVYLGTQAQARAVRPASQQTHGLPRATTI